MIDLGPRLYNDYIGHDYIGNISRLDLGLAARESRHRCRHALEWEIETVGVTSCCR